MHLGIVDTHLHLWDLDALDYPWLAPDAPKSPMFDISAFPGNYLPEDIRRDSGGRIIGAVFVQCECEDWVGEARWVQAQGDRTGLPDVMIVDGDPSADGFIDYLDTISDLNRLRGIRSRVFWHDDPEWRVAKGGRPGVLDEPGYRRGIRAMADRGLILEVGAFTHQLPDVRRLIADHPNMQFILPHLARPMADNYDGWRREMRAAAKLPNVAIKLSGLGVLDRNYETAVITPFVNDALEAFGVDRCMYGSDMPVEKFFCPFDRQIEALDEVFRSATAQERDAVFRTNAQRVYRFEQMAEVAA